MFDLIMTYCLTGQPCVNETVANFPQYDVGEFMCNTTKPAIEMAVRSRVAVGTRVTFKCQSAADGAPVEYEYQPPRQSQPAGVLEQVAPAIINQVQGLLR